MRTILIALFMFVAGASFAVTDKDEMIRKYDNHTSATWVKNDVLTHHANQISTQTFTRYLRTFDNGKKSGGIRDTVVVIIPAKDIDVVVANRVARFAAHNIDPRTLPDSEFDKLRQRVARLDTENADLRERVRRIENAVRNSSTFAEFKAAMKR